MIAKRSILACAFTLLGLLAMAGCGRAPAHANPDEAPKALRTVLDAWKGGQTREGFAQASPIQAADFRWEGGFKLLGYDVGPAESHGYGLNFQVTLHMEDAKGKKHKEQATYAVATSPRVMVRRVEDM